MSHWERTSLHQAEDSRLSQAEVLVGNLDKGCREMQFGLVLMAIHSQRVVL